MIPHKRPPAQQAKQTRGSIALDQAAKKITLHPASVRIYVAYAFLGKIASFLEGRSI